MTKEKFDQIVKEHNVTIVTGYDIENAIYFVADILRAEADLTEENEPYATRSIERYRQAAFVIEHEIDRDKLVEMFEEDE